MKKNNKFAHRDTVSSLESFYKIMEGKKKILTKKEEKDWEASYFAMCLLLPEDSFLKWVDFLGGIEVIKNDHNRTACLARVFNVELRLVTIRINDLQEQKTKNSKTLKLKR